MKILASILIALAALGTGYVVGSNNGKDFKEQLIDISFTCIQEQIKNNTYHQREARRIMQAEDLTKEQSNAYVKSTQFMCIERRVFK